MLAGECGYVKKSDCPLKSREVSIALDTSELDEGQALRVILSKRLLQWVLK